MNSQTKLQWYLILNKFRPEFDTKFMISIASADVLSTRQKDSCNKIISSFHVDKELAKYNLSNLLPIILNTDYEIQSVTCCKTKVELDNFAVYDTINKTYQSVDSIKDERKVVVAKRKLPHEING